MAIVTGTSGNDTLTGGLGTDELYALDGDDTLTGGPASDTAGDTLAGGAGNDTYLIAHPLDQIVEAAGEGVDEVRTDLATYTLGDNIEHLTYTGTAAFTGTGNGLDNRLTGGTGNDSLSGGAGNDTLDGGLGADTLLGGTGDDTCIVDHAGDVVTELVGEGNDTVRTGLASYTLGANVENLVYTGTASFSGTGNELDNLIQGGTGNDTLAGGLGADTLVGGAGNDVYLIDDAADLVVEAVGEGTDEVRTGLASYTLAANVENLTYTGSGSFTGTGNSGNNSLTGGAGGDVLTGDVGNDTLNGGASADTLIGGTGNDTYIVDDVGDVVTELAGEGTDTVRTDLASSTLGDHVENLVFTGSGSFTGTGNVLNNSLASGSGADVLTGLDGNDTLNGGAGADTLIGGAGNDTYVVDNAGDVLVELPGEGVDTVQSSITYTLLADFENLTLSGSAAIDGTGNAANNAITGNSGANLLTGLDGDDTLNGGTGADTLVGGAGNDLYVVDNAGDAVIELAGEGTDTVNASVSWVLGANLENLTLTGPAAINATGNELDNALTGNGGANILDGGLGDDSMAGGGGNDVYIVDSVGDMVTEAANQGFDEVRTSLASYALGANVEALTYTGGGPFTGAGNALDNRLAGVGGDDSLSGEAGNDTLIGGGGADTLDGGSGTDTASYAAATAGVVVDLSSGAGMAGEATGDVLIGIENLTGSAYADTLGGDAGGNLLDGGAGNDSLSGGLGNDTLIGGAGADTLAGGAGSDTAGYATASAGVAVDLASGTGTSGDAAGDVLSGIENLTGGSGADTLRGDGGGNRLDGGAGDDRLEGRGGNDTLIGGSGTDTAVFSGNVGDYAATLSGATWTIQALSGTDAIDTLQGVEIAQFADATIRLDGNNAPLVPNNLSAAVDEDATPLAVDLLYGVWDFEGSALSVTGLSQIGGPAATVSLSGGTLNLDPSQFNSLAAGQSAALTFAYGVSDGSADTARTLSVTVAGRNDAPVVSGPVTAATNEDAVPLVVNLLQGASDPDLSDTLSVTGFSQTGGRAVSVARTGGTLTLNPAQFNDLAVGEVAMLTFGYGVTDGTATTAQTLSVTVQGRNDAPVTTDDAVAVDYETSMTINPATLLGNDSDADGDGLTLLAVGNANGGVATLAMNGTVSFTPDAGFSGEGGFDYTVADGQNGSATGHVTVHVNPAPASPPGTPASLDVRAKTVVGHIAGPIDQAINQTYVTTLADGGYVAVWWSAEGNASDVYARRYSADGVPAGNAFLVNTTTANNQGGASVTALSDGGFVVAWHSMNGDYHTSTPPTTIVQQRFDATGAKVGAEMSVAGNSSTNKSFAASTGLQDGGWVVAWSSYQEDGSSWGSYGQRYTSNGQPAGSQFRINSYTAGAQSNPTLTGLTDGGFLVTWNSSEGQDGSGQGVYQQRYNAAGQAIGGEVRVNTTTSGHQTEMSATALKNGGWVVTWASQSQDGSGYGVYAKLYDANGAACTGEVQLNQRINGNQTIPSVQGLADGGFVALWNSYDDAGQNFTIQGRRFDAQGVAAGGEFQVSDGPYSAFSAYNRTAGVAAARGDGGFVSYWREPAAGGGQDIVTRVFAVGDAAPVLLANSGALGQGSAMGVAALVDSSHAQGARWAGGGLQTLTAYQFIDQTMNGDSGYFTVNGVQQAAGQAFTVSAPNLGNVAWHAGSGIGTDDFQARAFDGNRWSAWTGGTMTTVPVGWAQSGGSKTVVGHIAGAIDQAINQTYVTTLADGGYVAVWWSAEGNASDVYARRYSADGVPAGNAFLVNTTTANNQGGASVTALSDGGFVVAWHSMNGDYHVSSPATDILQQRFDGAGVKVGTEERVASNSSTYKDFAATAGLRDGGWVVGWPAVQEDGSASGCFGQRYAANGQPIGGQFQINSYTAGTQGDLTLTGLADGGFLATWDSQNQDGSGYGIYQQRYNAAGQAIGGEQRANVTTSGHQFYANGTALRDGGWVVTWQSQDQDGSGYGVYARVYGANGVALGGEVRLNQRTTGNQTMPSVQGTADGGFVALWDSYDAGGQTFAVQGRRFDAQGVAVGGEFQVSDGPYSAFSSYNRTAGVLSARSDGGFVSYWRESAAGGGQDIVTRVFSPTDTRLGKYTGTAGNDSLFGSTGSDTLTGGAGNDQFLLAAPGLTVDTITDFQPGIDRIEVVGPAFGGLPVGQLNAARFALDAPGDADDRFVFNTTTGALSYDPDGNGAMVATTFALLNVRSLSASDIWVVASA